MNQIESAMLALTSRNSASRILYAAALREFADYTGKPLDRVVSRDAMEFIAGQYRKRFADATVASRFGYLRSIYEFAVQSEMIDRNPFAPVARVLKRHGVQVRPTRVVEFHRVRDALCIKDKTEERTLQKRAMLCLFFGTGVRRSELLAGKVQDIRTNPRGILYYEVTHGKGGRVRQQPIPAWAAPTITRYVALLKARGAMNSSTLWPFFYVNGMTKFKPLSIQTIYRQYREIIGQPPHSARATYGTSLLCDGHNDRDVADAMGLANAKYVAVYDKRARGLESNIGRKVNYDEKSLESR